MHMCYAFDAYQESLVPTGLSAMPLNVELLLALANEQEQALLTVSRCRSQIARLLTEQLRINLAEQATEHIQAQQSTAAKKQKLEPDSSDQELLDKALLEAAQLYEQDMKVLSAHSTSSDQQVLSTATHKRTVQSSAQDMIIPAGLE